MPGALQTAISTRNLLIIAEDVHFGAALTRTVASTLPGIPVQLAAGLPEALDLLARGDTEMVLLDLSRSQGIEALEGIRIAGEDPAVIILGDRDDGPLFLQAIRLGAQDCLFRGDASGESFARTIRHTWERKQCQTAARLAEARRKESERLLACTLDSMKAAIAIADEKGMLLAANLPWKNQDLSKNPLVPSWIEEGSNYAEFCHSLLAPESSLAPAARGFLEVLRGDTPRFVQDFHWGEGPGIQGFGITINSFIVEGSRRVGIAIADITPRLITERNLRENQEMFRIISENAGDLVALLTPDGRRVYQNFAYSRALGYTMEELATLPPLDLLHPDDREGIQASLDELFRSHKDSSPQFRMRNKDGSWRHFEARAAVVDRASAAPALAIVVARDITERMKVDFELLRAHAVKNLILENSTLGITFVKKRVFEWVNSRMGEITGYPVAKLQNASTRIVYGDDASYDRFGQSIYPAMKRGERSDVTWQLQKGDGSSFWCRMIGRPLEPAHPDEGSVWLMEDITEKIKAEQERLSLEVQLRQAQKLEAIGQLAAGIAHEINTPIQYIGDNTKFLIEAFQDVFKVLDSLEGAKGSIPGPDSQMGAQQGVDIPYLREEIPMAIEQSLEGIARVTKIVRAMKDFSHPGGEETVDVDLNRSIESTITVSRNEWKYVADMVMDLDPGLPPVLCFPSEINQALLNLVINAAHAIADALPGDTEAKGIITVSTRQFDDQVEIRVGDTGTGIPEEVRSRIFDPFFTTKTVGKGTGQGLAIVHNVVVERHKGTVAFETEMGKGSTFILRIPIAGPALP